jgi:ribosome biogenesis GTPase A
MRTAKHWQEIFAVALAETDIVLEILDARNPIGTHNLMIEQFLQKNRPEIKIALVLNKIDMIPKPLVGAWLNYFKGEGYRIYSVSAKYKRGVMNLFSKLRNFQNKNHTNVLIVGYPNTGKSTLIESLTKGEKRVGTSPQAGFTRTIQVIKLTNNIYLIDTPGVIPIDEKNETDIAIKACMTADKLEDPMAVVEAIYKLLPRDQFRRLYSVDLTDQDGPDELIEKLGRKMGRLKSGGLVNEIEVQKAIIRDWQANKLKYYVLPPNYNPEKKPAAHELEDEEENSDVNE